MAIDVGAECPGRYVLHVDREKAGLPLLPVRISRDGATESQRFVLPALPSADFLVHVTSGSVRFSFDDAKILGVSIRRAGTLDLARAFERPRVTARIRLVLDSGLTIRPLLRGVGKPGRTLTRTMRALSHWGFGLESRSLRDTPDLLADIGPTAIATRVRQDAGKPRFVVALHLFYADLWPEFAHFLGSVRQPFRLIVTTVPGNGALIGDVRRAFPDATLVTVENRGRDVGPFIEILNGGHLDGFEFVLKLHGKATASKIESEPLGHVWRRATLIDLVGSEETVCRILERFDQDPEIGMIGSPRFRVPADLMSAAAVWAGNRSATLALAARLGIAEGDFQLDFFGGTMFWVRREVLEPLRQLGLAVTDFPEENGQTDGELHHAIERVFGALPTLLGKTLGEAPVDWL